MITIHTMSDHIRRDSWIRFALFLSSAVRRRRRDLDADADEETEEVDVDGVKGAMKEINGEDVRDERNEWDARGVSPSKYEFIRRLCSNSDASRLVAWSSL